MSSRSVAGNGPPSTESPDYSSYIAGLRERDDREAARSESLRRRALADARAAAEILRSRHGARLVLAFGSVARPGGFHASSDIDIAVEGLHPAEFFRAWSNAAAAVRGELDLVDLDDCPPRLRAVILREGKRL